MRWRRRRGARRHGLLFVESLKDRLHRDTRTSSCERAALPGKPFASTARFPGLGSGRKELPAREAEGQGQRTSIVRRASAAAARPVQGRSAAGERWQGERLACLCNRLDGPQESGALARRERLSRLFGETELQPCQVAGIVPCPLAPFAV